MIIPLSWKATQQWTRVSSAQDAQASAPPNRCVESVDTAKIHPGTMLRSYSPVKRLAKCVGTWPPKASRKDNLAAFDPLAQRSPECRTVRRRGDSETC